jgi:hypothetical protein
VRKIALPVLPAARPRAQHVSTSRLDGAVERYKTLHKDPVAAGLLTLIGSTDRIMHGFKVANGVARGFDEAGQEIVDVPVTEPIIERPAVDEKTGVVHYNTP